ncbi:MULTISPECIES: hypothetical protein [Calditerrivibrio]
MIKLNLLRFLDKSFSEIYQITHGEIEYKEEEYDSIEISEEEPKEQKPTQNNRKKLILVLSVVLGTVLLLSSVILVYFYYQTKVIEKQIAAKKTTLSHNEKGQKPKSTDNIHKEVESYNELSDFKPIGEIVFEEEKNRLANNSELSNFPKNVKSDNKTEAKSTQKKDDIKQYRYNLVIEDCYPGEIEKIKLALKDTNLSYISTEKGKIKLVVYKAYKYAEKSDLYIGNKPVNFLGYFYSKDEAVSFLRENSLKGIVTSKMEEVTVYKVEITYFNSESEISQFLVKTKLNNKKIRVDKS